MMLPRESTTTAPTGTSPSASADTARSSACCISSSYVTRSPDDRVQLVAEPQPIGDVAQDVLGVEVVVVAQHAELEGGHAEIADDLEVAGRLTIVLVVGIGKVEQLGDPARQGPVAHSS